MKTAGISTWIGGPPAATSAPPDGTEFSEALGQAQAPPETPPPAECISVGEGEVVTVGPIAPEQELDSAAEIEMALALFAMPVPAATLPLLATPQSTETASVIPTTTSVVTASTQTLPATASSAPTLAAPVAQTPKSPAIEPSQAIVTADVEAAKSETSISVEKPVAPLSGAETASPTPTPSLPTAVETKPAAPMAQGVAVVATTDQVPLPFAPAEVQTQVVAVSAPVDAPDETVAMAAAPAANSQIAAKVAPPSGPVKSPETQGSAEHVVTPEKTASPLEKAKGDAGFGSGAEGDMTEQGQTFSAKAAPADVSAPEPKPSPLANETKPVSTVQEVTAKAETLPEPAQRQIARQALEHLDYLLAAAPRKEVTIRLDPQELGTLTLRIVQSEGRVEAKIEATDNSVRQALVDQRPNLDRALHQKGLALGDVTVTAQFSADRHSGQPNRQPAPQAHNVQPMGPDQDVDVESVRVVRKSGKDVDLWI